MAADERDNAMAGLLRRGLSADAVSKGDCPGSDILAAYYERSLDSDELPGCELHVSRCARCREQLAMMARTEAPPQPESRHGWLWDWRLLAAAAAALMILTVWGVHQSGLKPAGYRTANAPLVAMSRPEQSPSTQPPRSTPAPPSGVAGESRLQQELDKLSPQMKTSAPAAPQVVQKKLSRDLPVNGGDAENLLKEKPEGEVTEQPNRLAEPSALDEKSAAPPAPILAGPTAMAQSAATSSAANAGGRAATGNVTPGAVAGATAESPRAKMQSGAVVDRFGAANERALAQSAELQPAQTIIRTPNPKVLWRIAGGGFVERSEDTGATWHGQLPESNAHLTAGAAPTTKALWLVGENGVILFTKDAAHWKRIPPPIPADFASVDAKSASSATVTATDGQKFSTSDSGKKWVPAP